ncbi:hypothetical protein N836_28925 [Leptolyngbya sp. Heron Island J]|uniref:hypothetical protein n=1 Tax=Leptolyngbya sp. Heron Island J TaxID=1385935 RepID=UPI0003B9B0C5|nr:hypothetical protein [Leptolyngbya sp. Heron Island J]ESA39102.1 hypothetical protein N836_28925 [Leptolyngbya sp. Heron Island J]
MAKQRITTTQLQRLAQYQQQLDTTIEYVSDWSLAALRKEAKEANEAVALCSQEIDGVAADGTYNYMAESEWVLLAEVVEFVLGVRESCKKLTERQLDVVEGVA